MPGGERVSTAATPAVLQNVPFPSKLETKGNLASNWKRFRRVWLNYEVASRLVKQPKEDRTATLLTCIGADALEIVDGLNFANEDEGKDIDVVLEKLEVFCVGEINEIYERYQFNKGIRSRASPSILMSRQFTPWRKRVIMVHSWIVLFATELYNGTRKRLLQLAKLTLNECIDICRCSEATAAQLQAMGNQEDL